MTGSHPHPAPRYPDTCLALEIGREWQLEIHGLRLWACARKMENHYLQLMKPDETYYKKGDAYKMGVGIHLQTCLFYIRGEFNM